jgi:hypothetical protein
MRIIQTLNPIRLSLRGIFRLLVVSRIDGIVGDVNVDDFSHFQLLIAQLVHLIQEIISITFHFFLLTKSPSHKNG